MEFNLYRAPTNSISTLSTMFSEKYGISEKLVENILKHPSRVTINETKEDYDTFRNLIHDIFGGLILMSRSLQNSELSFQTTLEQLGLISKFKSEFPNYSDYLIQKPDYTSINSKRCHFLEFSVTWSLEQRRRNKQLKYRPVFEFLKRNGYTINYEIFILDLSYGNVDTLSEQIGEDVIPNIEEVLTNIIDSVREVESAFCQSEAGTQIMKEVYNLEETKNYQFEEKDLERMIEESKSNDPDYYLPLGEYFMDFVRQEGPFKSYSGTELNDEDKKYLDDLTSFIQEKLKGKGSKAVVDEVNLEFRVKPKSIHETMVKEGMFNSKLSVPQGVYETNRSEISNLTTLFMKDVKNENLKAIKDLYDFHRGKSNYDRLKPKKVSIFPLVAEAQLWDADLTDYDKVLLVLDSVNRKDPHSQLLKDIQIELSKYDFDEKSEFNTAYHVDLGPLEEVDKYQTVDFNNKHVLKLKYGKSSQVYRTMTLEGPGRKQHFEKGSVAHVEEATKHTGIWLDFQFDTSEISDIFKILSSNSDEQSEVFLKNIHAPSEQLDGTENIINIDSKKDIRALSKKNGIIAASFIQEVVREVALNLKRNKRNDRFIISPTKLSNTLILLPPGPSVRTDETPYWFKIISKNRLLIDNSMTVNIHQHGFGLWSTEWISLTSKDMSFWLRCPDMIAMTYAAMLSEIKNIEDSLCESIGNDSSDILGIISTLVINNKTSVSETLQDARYIAMKQLSLDRYVGDLLKKLHKPIREPLLLELLKREIKFIERCQDINTLEMIKSVSKTDEETGEKLVGYTSNIPRLFSNGPNYTLGGLLQEIYMCMLYDKDKGKKIPDSFKIVSKIMEEEVKLYDPRNVETLIKSGLKVNEKMKKHIENDIRHVSDGWLPGVSDIDFAKSILNSKKTSHFSSLKTINVASKMNLNSKDLRLNGPLAVKKCLQSRYIRESLETFATFKASVLDVKERPDFDEGFKKYCRQMGFNEEKISEDVKQMKKPEILSASLANRTKCIESILLLLNNFKDEYPSLTKLDDIWPILFKLTKGIKIQIFKKNQIGGVREIIILDMMSRLLIQVTEAFARALCELDGKEMLTKGSKKHNITIRNISESIRLAETKYMQFYHNCDMSRWCQQFMMINFLCSMSFLRGVNESYWLMICMLQVLHSNKMIEIPRDLYCQWLRFPEKKHLEDHMTVLKKHCLNHGVSYFINVSNMGQGIEHYTSSWYHCCHLTFFNYIFNEIAKLNNMDYQKCLIKHQCSSDDRLTILTLSISSIEKSEAFSFVYLYHIVNELTQKMSNIKEGVAKSCFSNIVHEFNSSFGVRSAQKPPVIKFAKTSVQPMNTDSVTDMINTGFNNVLQLRINGGSSELCQIAHCANKQFTENMYHTGVGQWNDPGIHLGIPRNNVPWDLGIYPLFDPTIMEIAGPEFWNFYNIKETMFKEIENKDIILNLYSNLYISARQTEMDLFDSEISQHDVEKYFYRSPFFDVKVNASRKLKFIRRRVEDLLGLSAEGITNIFSETPELFLLGPRDLNDVMGIAAMNLYTRGARQSLRISNYAQQYLRHPALYKKRVYQCSLFDEILNYSEMLLKLKRLTPERVITESDIPIFFINFEAFESWRDIYGMSITDKSYLPRVITNKQAEMCIRQTILNLENDLKSVLSKCWFSQEIGVFKQSSYRRDLAVIKQVFPWFDEKLKKTAKNLFGVSKIKNEQLFILIKNMSFFFSRHRRSVIKMYINGSSTSSPLGTYKTILRFNSESHRLIKFSVKTNYKVTKTSFGMSNALKAISNYYTLIIRSQFLNKVTEDETKKQIQEDMEETTINYRPDYVSSNVFDIVTYSIKEFIETFFDELFKVANTTHLKNILLILTSCLKTSTELTAKAMTAFNPVKRQWIRPQTLIREEKGKRLQSETIKKWTGDYHLRLQLNDTIVEIQGDDYSAYKIDISPNFRPEDLYRILKSASRIFKFESLSDYLNDAKIGQENFKIMDADEETFLPSIFKVGVNSDFKANLTVLDEVKVIHILYPSSIKFKNDKNSINIIYDRDRTYNLSKSKIEMYPVEDSNVLHFQKVISYNGIKIDSKVFSEICDIKTSSFYDINFSDIVLHLPKDIKVDSNFPQITESVFRFCSYLSTIKNGKEKADEIVALFKEMKSKFPVLSVRNPAIEAFMLGEDFENAIKLEPQMGSLQTMIQRMKNEVIERELMSITEEDVIMTQHELTKEEIEKAYDLFEDFDLETEMIDEALLGVLSVEPDELKLSDFTTHSFLTNEEISKEVFESILSTSNSTRVTLNTSKLKRFRLNKHDISHRFNFINYMSGLLKTGLIPGEDGFKLALSGIFKLLKTDTTDIIVQYLIYFLMCVIQNYLLESNYDLLNNLKSLKSIKHVFVGTDESFKIFKPVARSMILSHIIKKTDDDSLMRHVLNEF